MANLITEKQKRIIKIEYLVRLGTTSLFILSLFALFFLAYVIPYYISVSNKDKRTAEQFKSVINIENKENTGESVTKVVKATLDQMKTVELYYKNNITPSVYFNKIIENKNSNIKITKLSFNMIKEGQGQLIVGGVSKNREGLVAFIEDLKSVDGFTGVESPVSDFAKDSDISFSLDIKTVI